MFGAIPGMLIDGAGCEWLFVEVKGQECAVPSKL
jgi:hypothetical protein